MDARPEARQGASETPERTREASASRPYGGPPRAGPDAALRRRSARPDARDAGASADARTGGRARPRAGEAGSSEARPSPTAAKTPQGGGLRESEIVDVPQLVASETRPVLLLSDHPDAALRAAEEIARRLRVPLHRCWAGDAPPREGYDWALAQLRHATHVRTRVLAKVLEGRIEELAYEMQPNPLAPNRTEPRAAQLRLSTTDDERVLRLEGAFAVKLWRLGAKRGDIVQIDRTAIRVSIRHDRERAEGWVQEERDFVWTESLRELDLAEARFGETLLGTGHEPPVPSDVARRVDDEVRREIAAGRATLLPGLLLIHEAERLLPEALAPLRRAARMDAAPLLLFNGTPGSDLVRLSAEVTEPVLLRT